MKNQPYELPELGFKYDALEPALSAEIVEVHYCKHHQAYVDGANQALGDLAEERERGDSGHLNELQKDLAFNVSGHVLHSLFWRNLMPSKGAGPDSFLSGYVKRAFGDLEAMEEQFRSAGSSVQGSGWAALAWDPVGQLLVVEQIHDHQNNTVVGAVPLLVMDMWEHAYYLQYRNEKKRWIDAFWSLINWQEVSGHLRHALELDLGWVTSELPAGKVKNK